MGLVSLDKGQDASLGLLGLNLSSKKSDSSVIVETSLGSVVQVSQAKGIMSESLTVELDLE